jgi:hypothetical protein
LGARLIPSAVAGISHGNKQASGICSRYDVGTFIFIYVAYVYGPYRGADRDSLRVACIAVFTIVNKEGGLFAGDDDIGFAIAI